MTETRKLLHFMFTSKHPILAKCLVAPFCKCKSPPSCLIFFSFSLCWLMHMSKRQAFNKLHSDWPTWISAGELNTKAKWILPKLALLGFFLVFLRSSFGHVLWQEWRTLFKNNGTSQSHSKEGLKVGENLRLSVLSF